MDDNDWQQSYDCNDPNIEPVPNLLMYQPEFHQLNAQYKKLINLLSEPILASGLNTPPIAVLRRKFAELSNRVEGRRIKIAVCGDMASGKSSTINSLLSVGMIARKADTGESCTLTIQSYMHEFPGQTASFAAKITFMDEAAIASTIKALLHKYHGATEQRRSNTGDSVKTLDEDPEIREENRQDEASALTALRSIFCQHEVFESDETARKYLATEDHANTKQLVSWAIELVDEHLDGREFVYFEQNTVEALLRVIAPYTHSTDDNVIDNFPEPFTLVQHVEYGFKTRMVETGIVLVDSPGLSDADRTRRHRALASRRKCSHVIIVASIKRAQSDGGLHQQLADVYRSHGSGNIVLVLTHADELDDDSEVSSTKEDKAQMDKLDKKRRSLDADIRKELQSRRLASGEELEDINQTLVSLRGESREVLVEWRTLRLGLRNRKVSIELQKIYRNITGDTIPLPVHAVGNKLYQQYQSGFYAEDTPWMAVQATGIPVLRAALLALPSQDALNEIYHRATTQLPQLVSYVERYCRGEYMPHKAELEKKLGQVKLMLPEEVQRLRASLTERTEQVLLTVIKTKEGDWAHTAGETCNEWAKIYPTAVHWQVLKKHGFRPAGRMNKTTGKPSRSEVNWNLEILDISKGDLDHGFVQLFHEAGKAVQSFGLAISKQLRLLAGDIRGDARFDLMTLDTMFADLKVAQSALLKSMTAAFQERFVPSFNLLRSRATMFSDDAFVVMSLHRLFNEAIQYKGKKGVPQRLLLLQRELSKHGGLWTDLSDNLEQELGNAFGDVCTSIEADVARLLDGVVEGFQIMCKNHAGQVEELKGKEDDLRALLSERLKAAKELVAGPIKENAEKCKNFLSSKNPTTSGRF